jgi:hypothetical protein
MLALANILLGATFPLSELLRYSSDIPLIMWMMGGLFGATCAIAVVPLIWFALGDSPFWIRWLVTLVCAEFAQIAILAVQTWGSVGLWNGKVTGPTLAGQLSQAAVATALVISFMAAMSELVRVGIKSRFGHRHESDIAGDSAHSVGIGRILITITVLAAITPFLQRHLIREKLWIAHVLMYQISLMTIVFGVPLAISKIIVRRSEGIVRVIVVWNVLLSVSIIVMLIMNRPPFASAGYWIISILSLVVFWAAYHLVAWATLVWARRQLGWFYNARATGVT